MHDAVFILTIAASVGVFLMVAGGLLRIPAIVLLLAGGIAIGPYGLGVIDPHQLGEGLETLVALIIAIILFEGGLTLDFAGYRRSPVMIRRLLTVGPLITWLGASAAIFFLWNTKEVMALMVASLIIVTGPTVVLPILRRIHIREKLHHVLYWEGVLIDVVGVFIAVLCYEWLTSSSDLPILGAIRNFGVRILIGGGLGALGGLLVALMLRRAWIKPDHVNIFVLAVALLIFGVSHHLLPESGVLAVVVAGMVVAVSRPPRFGQLKQFKLQLTEVGIATIFVLLAAKLELNRFGDWRLAVLLLVLVFVLRPLAVWICSAGQGYKTGEKLFLSWIAPRGIVAASMASLFAFRLSQLGMADAHLLETVTYAVVIFTVAVQGLSAPLAARLLGVTRKDRRTWVIFGNAVLTRALGGALRRGGVKTVEVNEPLGEGGDFDSGKPQFMDVDGVLFADDSMLANVWTAAQWGFHLNAANYYRWATFEGDRAAGEGGSNESLPCQAVWHTTVTASSVAAGLSAKHQFVDLVEIGSDRDQGRFGQGLLPLFWIKDGRATLVADPQNTGTPEGEMAVVLRQRPLGLAERLAHVEVVEEKKPGFAQVVERLLASVARILPDVDVSKVGRDIEEQSRTLPAAVGGGIAIPHTYSAAVDKSVCLLAVVPDGVTDLKTPDDLPATLVFMLISPEGTAAAHLDALASIAGVGQEPEFVALLSRQRVPARIASLIAERG